jgi:hypothetical protein
MKTYETLDTLPTSAVIVDAAKNADMILIGEVFRVLISFGP